MDDEDLESADFGIDDWLKAVGGILFFIASLLPWWSYSFPLEVGSLSFYDNAFDFVLTGAVPSVIFVAIALLTIVNQTGSLRVPAVLMQPLLWLVLAAIATGLVGYRFFIGGDDGSRGLGLYVAAASALLVLAGCVITYRELRAEPFDDEAVDATTPVRRPTPPLP